jgi:hypothetical protein
MTTAMLPIGAPDHDAIPAQFVVPQEQTAYEELFAGHTAWIRLPSLFTDLLKRVHELTGWSFRDIAGVIGTSHTTVGKLAGGAAPTPKSQAAAGRIGPLLDVLVRLAALAAPGRDLGTVLVTPSPGGDRPLDFLQSGDWPDALLAAMDVINGPRPARPKLRHGVQVEPATQELR